MNQINPIYEKQQEDAKSTHFYHFAADDVNWQKIRKELITLILLLRTSGSKKNNSLRAQQAILSAFSVVVPVVSIQAIKTQAIPPQNLLPL